MTEFSGANKHVFLEKFSKLLSPNDQVRKEATVELGKLMGLTDDELGMVQKAQSDGNIEDIRQVLDALYTRITRCSFANSDGLQFFLFQPNNLDVKDLVFELIKRIRIEGSEHEKEFIKHVSKVVVEANELLQLVATIHGKYGEAREYNI